MKSVLWLLVNALQAIFLGLWTVFWSTLALLLWLPTRDTRMPLAIARRLWAPPLLRLAGIRLRVAGVENVDFSRPHYFAANHQSMTDVPVLLRVLPIAATWVVKHELLSVPFVGWYIRAMGMISLNRNERLGSLAQMRQSPGAIAGRRNLVVFPEGERTPDGQIGPFKPGAFVPAIEAGLPVVPIAIEGAFQVLPIGTFRVRPGTIRVAVGEPIPTEGLKTRDRKALARMVRDRVVTLWQGLLD